MVAKTLPTPMVDASSGRGATMRGTDASLSARIYFAVNAKPDFLLFPFHQTTNNKHQQSR
jgi:hypothetical protein